MHELIDRPVREQAAGVRLCVWAMRQWVRAALDGKCVCHVIAAEFEGTNAARASVPFHEAMRTLCSNARVALRFGCVDRLAITEHEAIILAAATAAAEGRRQDLQAIARWLVFPDFAPALAASLTSVAEAFAAADIAFSHSG